MISHNCIILVSIIPKSIRFAKEPRCCVGMANPFKYGRIVTGEDFADREKEIEQLLKDLKSGQNILLYSPRRYGKTSLIINVLNVLLKEKIITVFIDLYGCISISDLVDKIIEETVIPAQGTVQKVADFLKGWISNLRPEIALNPDGSIDISLKKEVQALGAEKVLSQILDAPQKLAETKKRPVIVVFDEFQEISNMDGLNIEKTMRSRFQNHKNVTYLFAGSRKHLIDEIFGQEKRPFYKFAKPFPIENIPRRDFAKFIHRKFKETKILIDPKTIELVLDFTKGHPYFTQQLCHEIWNIASEINEVKEADLAEAIKTILYQHGDYFTRIWDSLALSQRKLMFALAQENKVTSVYSTFFIEKYDLTSASHVKKAVDYLEKEGIIEHDAGAYYIGDIFLNEWVKDKICSSNALNETSPVKRRPRSTNKPKLRRHSRSQKRN